MHAMHNNIMNINTYVIYINIKYKCIYITIKNIILLLYLA